MAATVDTGRIIDVARFPVAADETVASLLQRTYAAMSAQFQRVMDGFLRTGEFPVSAQQWTRKPFTRVQFEALRRIDPGMPADEVARRVRATDYPPYGPYVELHGFKFKLAKDPV
jgi:methionyl-tRNA formyltransferase